MRQSARKKRLRKRDIWTIGQLRKRRERRAEANSIKRWARERKAV